MKFGHVVDALDGFSDTTGRMVASSNLGSRVGSTNVITDPFTKKFRAWFHWSSLIFLKPSIVQKCSMLLA